MDIRSALSGIASLQKETLGDPGVCVAVVDGPVDLSHPCFAGAAVERVDTLVKDPPGAGGMSAHGTHVTSLIFGQPGGPVAGVAPGCRGLVVPVFRDFEEGHLPQLDLARALEQAVQLGANVISVSGGERSASGEADAMLERALRRCRDSNVLVVAAAGNDGCECLHVPAAVPSVLAVGAFGKDGRPLEISNWGQAYRSNGVLAAGEEITGAAPGGGTATRTGTSFATPLVAGIAALLLSVQRNAGKEIDPRGVGEAILATATACPLPGSVECARYLKGALNIPGAHAAIRKGGETAVADLDTALRPAPVAGVAAGQAGAGPSQAADAGVQAADAGVQAADGTGAVAADAGTGAAPAGEAGVPSAAAAPAVAGGSVTASEDCGCKGVRGSEACNCQGSAVTAVRQYVYALGTIGFDFGTEARRDTFRQSMPDVERQEDGTPVRVSANPYDVFQLTDYLSGRPSESTKLIWTLNLDLTPIYALEAEIAYPEEVYRPLRQSLRLQALPPENPEFVSRVSVPGVLTSRSVRLFSGQVVPVVEVQPRGLYTWNEPMLVKQVVETVAPESGPQRNQRIDPDRASQLVRIFLDKVYFEARNLGLNPADRALNFAATNAFQVASGILRGFLSGDLVPDGEATIYTLDSIDVAKSPYCRVGSDCYDVLIKWFDPENDRRAKSIHQFTIDVSDELPVTIAPSHQYFAT